ncbi:hypothetical protein BDA99DRAFT_557549 [Phascolomyces articulosus]|uniref:Uncharacterized protein n=1 Tax=Phascolomyces articulosus TaxID=60185 RepID=A0AAD5KG35_9FUNG|nr:hypothetical protein BDA99DRAFT_534853 [Phascolomyces articulosus]KAI9270746.1 hypothetical protein BDA99DRAFT_557549 [Phascolomyces articulosus]
MSKRKPFELLENVQVGNHVKKIKIGPTVGSLLFKLPYESLHLNYEKLEPYELVALVDSFVDLKMSVAGMKHWKRVYEGSHLNNHRPSGRYNNYFNCLYKEISRLCDMCFIKCPRAGSKSALYTKHVALDPPMKFCVQCRAVFYTKNPEPIPLGFSSLNIIQKRAQ